MLGWAGGEGDVSPNILVAHPKLSTKFQGPSQNIENVSWPILWYVCQGILINKFARSHKDDFQFENE